MNKVFVIFRNQVSMFLSDKGMLVFYFLSALVTGVLVPLFSRSITTCLSFGIVLTGTFLIPILADSMAGEREKKTLEALLSTGIKGKNIIYGKFLMAGLFALVFFTCYMGSSMLIVMIGDIATDFTAVHWVLSALLAIMHFLTIILGGLYQSTLSGDTQMAYTKIAFLTYPASILYMAGITSITVNKSDYIGVVLLLFLFLYAGIAMIFSVKIARIKQQTYFENVKYRSINKKQNIRIHELGGRSQIRIVFAHEMRYLATLKLLLFNFLILCVTPAIVCMLGKYYLGSVDLNYAVLLTAFIIPRAPTNLIAYSIGGEKTYKTAETLLSTPLNTRPIFYAKMMVPVVVSGVMLILSSTLTLICANIVSQYLQIGTWYMYKVQQLILLFPAGILSCISMTFVTGALSVRMKKPRNGLYASTIFGIFFVVPPFCIVYLTGNQVLWSLIYCFFLILVNVLCLAKISNKISRPQLMNWI